MLTKILSLYCILFGVSGITYHHYLISPATWNELIVNKLSNKFRYVNHYAKPVISFPPPHLEKLNHQS